MLKIWQAAPTGFQFFWIGDMVWLPLATVVPAAIISQVDEPLLVLHGTADKVVPFSQGQTVFELAGSSDKQMVPFADVGHSGLWSEQGVSAIIGFLDGIGQAP